MVTFQLGVNQPAVADLVRIFRIEAQYRFTGAQGHFHLLFFHQGGFQRIQHFTHHHDVFRFIEIVVFQFGAQTQVALDPHFQLMFVQRFAI
ncbi:hypothetical protein D3C79_839230 [compost metagenome]